MGNLTHKAVRAAAGLGIDQILKKVNRGDREAEMVKLLDMMNKYIAGSNLSVDFDAICNMVTDKSTALNQYINRALDEVDPNVLKTTALNFGFEAMINGTMTIRKMREVHQCNIPWLILMDPTSACNLHCTGCWAAEYGNKLNLSYEELASVVRQGRELGVYFYMFTGGEPLVRKKDVIRLCKEFNDCQFLAFTNGTLVDQTFCDEMKQVGNLMLAISLEGDPEVNDLRRGQGVYAKVMHAMGLLKENGLIFGTSICYTRDNIEAVTSDEFMRFLCDKGAHFGFYFHYMPVGNEAAPELMPTPEQRKYMIDRIRYLRSEACDIPFYPMDFQNDGEFVGGCIAGGRNYFHINSAGDAEPCVFIHYSNANIHDSSILEILQSPLFMAYHNGQPFNKNHLRPCPMLENPELLRKMVHETGAHSTDLQSPESVDHLCDKCKSYAANWQPTADEIWSHTKIRESRYENYKDWKPNQQ
mgnify:CR=1 FL=1